MSVQLSVVIWTVINFCILMLVLWKLLFKPTLAFMDKRAEKIRRVRDEKAELEAASAAEAAKAAAESAGKKEREAAAKAAAIAAIREEAEKREAGRDDARRQCQRKQQRIQPFSHGAASFPSANGHILRRRQKLSRLGQCLLHTFLTGKIADQIGLALGLQIFRHRAVAEGWMFKICIHTYHHQRICSVFI